MYSGVLLYHCFIMYITVYSGVCCLHQFFCVPAEKNLGKDRQDGMVVFIWDIASLCINLSLKTVQLAPPIFGQFCEKTNILFFSPKYLGLPVLTKYFVKQNCFLSWGRPPFLLFYPNFGSLLHLQYMKFTKKLFHKVVHMENIFHLQP